MALSPTEPERRRPGGSIVGRAVPTLVLGLMVSLPGWAQVGAFEASAQEAAQRHRAMDYRGAVAVLEPAVVRARQALDDYWHGRLLAQKGRSWANAGSRHRANEDLVEAVRLLEQTTHSGRIEAELEFARGALLLINEGRQAALISWERSVELLRAVGDVERATEVDADRANAMASLRPAEAIELAVRVLKEVNPVTEPQAARALGAKAYGLQALGLVDEALAAYDVLVPLAASHNDQQTLRFAYCNRADLLRKLGRYQDAEDDLRSAVAGFEESRDANQLLGAERTNFLDRQVNAYERWILLLADTYRGNQAFDIAERFHARSFLDMLRERDLDRAARRVPALRERELELYAQMAQLRFGEQDAAEGDSFQQLAVALADHHSAIRSKDVRYAELVRPTQPSQEQLRDSLAEGEVLVAYWRAQDRLIAWTLTKTQILTTQVPLAAGVLEAAIEGYTKPLRSQALAEDLDLSGGAREHLGHGRALFRLLIEPLPAAVHQAQRLLIVRHGDLNRLAFEALVSHCTEGVDRDEGGPAVFHRDYRDCSYLGLEKEIVYSPSAGSLLLLRERTLRSAARSRGKGEGRATAVLAVAPGVASDPLGGGSAVRGLAQRSSLEALRFAQEEARAIGKLLPESNVVLADAASESWLLSVLKRRSPYSILHFATHGLVDDVAPMTSALLLEGDAEADGLMLAGEVLALTLDADLVTLSACRTARGQLRRGEGFVGLQQSFLYAGASSVLASLWDVDDEATLRFMKTFYGHLAEGNPRSRALLLTRRELVQQTSQRRVVLRERPVSLAHPRFWAAFTLTGVP